MDDGSASSRPRGDVAVEGGSRQRTTPRTQWVGRAAAGGTEMDVWGLLFVWWVKLLINIGH